MSRTDQGGAPAHFVGELQMNTTINTTSVRVPNAERLLAHYQTVGCPVREGALFDVYGSPRGKPWVVLYVRPGAPAVDQLPEFIALGQLISRGKEEYGGEFAAIHFPEVELLMFRFRIREEAKQFERDAMALLRPLIGAPQMENWIRERTLTLGGQAREPIAAAAREPNPLVHEFFDFN
jgi:hypothetical protein